MMKKIKQKTEGRRRESSRNPDFPTSDGFFRFSSSSSSVPFSQPPLHSARFKPFEQSTAFCFPPRHYFPSLRFFLSAFFSRFDAFPASAACFSYHRWTWRNFSMEKCNEQSLRMMQNRKKGEISLGFTVVSPFFPSLHSHFLRAPNTIILFSFLDCHDCLLTQAKLFH